MDLGLPFPFFGALPTSAPVTSEKKLFPKPMEDPMPVFQRIATVQPTDSTSKMFLKKLCERILEQVDCGELPIHAVHQIINSVTALKIFTWSSSHTDRRDLAQACLEVLICAEEIWLDSQDRLWVPKGLVEFLQDEDLEFLMHRFPGYLPAHLDILNRISPQMRKKVARKRFLRRLQERVSPQHPKAERLLQRFLEKLACKREGPSLESFRIYHREALQRDFRAGSKDKRLLKKIESYWTAEARQWFLRQEMVPRSKSMVSPLPQNAQVFRGKPQMGKAIRAQAEWLRTLRQVAVAQAQVQSQTSKRLTDGSLNWVYGLFQEEQRDHPSIAFKAWTPVITEHEVKLCVRDFCLKTWDAMVSRVSATDLQSTLHLCLDRLRRKFRVPRNELHLLSQAVNSLSFYSQQHRLPSEPSTQLFQDLEQALFNRFEQILRQIRHNPIIKQSTALGQLADSRATRHMQRCEKLVSDICQLCGIPGRPSASPMRARVVGPLGNHRTVNGTACSYIPGACCLEEIYFMPRKLRDSTLENLGTHDVQLLILLHLLLAYQDGHGKNLLISPEGIIQLDVDAILNPRQDKSNHQGRAPLRSALLGLPQAMTPLEPSVLDAVDENWDWAGILQLCTRTFGKKSKSLITTLKKRVDRIQELLQTARKENLTPLRMAFQLFPSYLAGWCLALEKGYPDEFSATWVGRYKLSKLRELPPYCQLFHELLEKKGYPPALIITFVANHPQYPFQIPELPEYNWQLHESWVKRGKSHHQAAALVMTDIASMLPISEEVLSILEQVPMWIDTPD